MGGNIRNYNFNKIDVRLSDSEYYDFYLTQDETSFELFDGIISGSSLIAEFDFDNTTMIPSGITSADTIFSLSTWEDAVNTGLTLDNIGLTGIDNGLLTFNKLSGDTLNTALTETLTGTTLQILSGETSFILHPVTGMTGNYIYPIDILSASTVGRYAQLCGGYYQGFYKVDNDSYQTLPNRFAKGWTTEFWLNKTSGDCSGHTATTINDDFSGNTGIFFYLGTRAENKFWNIFGGDGVDGRLTLENGGFLTQEDGSYITISGDTWRTSRAETGETTTSGYPLSPPPLTITDIDNNFLIYSRADGTGGCGQSDGTVGKMAYTWSGGIITTTATTTEITDARNKFITFSRADGTGGCGQSSGATGLMVYTYSGDSSPILELDYEADLVNNSFALRVKDDGSIGYRALRFTCVTATTAAVTTISSGITVEEAYSASGMVSDDEWTHVTVKFVADTRYNDCELALEGARNGKLMFYVNGRLKYVVNNFTEIVPQRLGEWYQKQEAVPFNISLGGGSQGLVESMTFDGQDPADMGLPIEENFAGTFIGGINKFRMYDEPLSWCQIKNNYETEATEFGLI